MYTLTYRSIAVVRPSDRQMERILENARHRNSIQNITGCLIHFSGGFIQLIEGEKDDVLDLFEKIKEDPRHEEVNLFSQDVIKERSFPDWGMLYLNADGTNATTYELENFKRNLIILADLSKPSNVTAMLFWKHLRFMVLFPPLLSEG